MGFQMQEELTWVQVVISDFDPRKASQTEPVCWAIDDDFYL